MKQILKNEISAPTKIFETNSGYIVKSRLPNKGMTLPQAVLLSVTFLLTGIVGQASEQAGEIAAAFFLFFLFQALIFPLPVFVEFSFNKSAQTVGFKKSFIPRGRYPIDDSSVFVSNVEDHQIEYRRGLNQADIAAAIQFKAQKETDIKKLALRMAGLIAALNETMKRSKTEQASATQPENNQDMNPLD
jgi:hypothetical protein